MRIKFIPAVLAAVALAAAPAAAAPKPAPAAPVAASEVQPGSEDADGDQLRRRGFLLPLAIIIAIILGVILLTHNGDETPASP